MRTWSQALGVANVGRGEVNLVRKRNQTAVNLEPFSDSQSKTEHLYKKFSIPFTKVVVATKQFRISNNLTTAFTYLTSTRQNAQSNLLLHTIRRRSQRNISTLLPSTFTVSGARRTHDLAHRTHATCYQGQG